MAVARRVAEEVGSEVGGVVGYSVRFDEKYSPATKIKVSCAIRDLLTMCS